MSLMFISITADCHHLVRLCSQFCKVCLNFTTESTCAIWKYDPLLITIYLFFLNHHHISHKDGCLCDTGE